MTTTPEQIEAVFQEMARRRFCSKEDVVECSDSLPISRWCAPCLMRVAAEAWAERERLEAKP